MRTRTAPPLYPTGLRNSIMSSGHHFHKSAGIKGMEYLARLFSKSQMDFQYALWQMSHLMVNPAKVYNSTKTRKHIKNQWARDDPAFVVLLLLLMLVSNIIHTLAFGERTFSNILAVILETIFFDFIFISVLFSSIFWITASRKLQSINDRNRMNNNNNESNNNNNNSKPWRINEQRSLLSLESITGKDGSGVEWLYAFDIHCNSYFIYFIISNVILLLLSPIMLREGSLFSLILGNSIYLIAIVMYFYITFLGYQALPTTSNTEILLYPLPIVLILYIVSLLTHFSVTHRLLRWHYGYGA